MNAPSARHGWKLMGLVAAVAAISVGALHGGSSAVADTPAEWMPVTDMSLEIVGNSALDFSRFQGTGADTATSIVGGHFKAGDGAVPLNCASLAPGFSPTPGSGFPSHEDADRYAAQLRMHGYNLVRFHYVDALLMQGATADFAVNPQQLDRFHYFTSVLARNGIRWLLDIASSPNIAVGSSKPNRWMENRGLIWRTYVEDAAFQHWQKWATLLLTDVNPYTGRTLAQDPGTMGVILVNEPGLMYRSFVTGGGPNAPFLPGVADGYAGWQKVHFPGQPPLVPPPGLSATGPAMERFQAYLTDIQRSVTVRMTKVVRASGYTGPVTSFDNWPMINQLPLRRDLDFIDMHGYAQTETPSKKGGFEAVSVIKNGGRYLQNIAMTRVFGRPMTVSEHGNFFPNPLRFESGLMVPAFAAIQGWDAVCQHADGPIDLAYNGLGVRKDAIHGDSVGLDPVRRAGETLTALLLLRREIAPATGAFAIVPNDATALQAAVTEGFGPEIGQLGWAVRVGIKGDARLAGPSVEVPLERVAPRSVLGRLFGSPRDSFIDDLLNAGAITAKVAGDARASVWRSPDGTVVLDQPAGRLNVVTRLTAATAGGQVDSPLSLGPVRVLSSSAPALIAVSGLDGKTLDSSGRILVMLASDARNSDMIVDEAQSVVINNGRLPVTVKRVQAKLELSGVRDGRWSLTPLHLNGSEMKAVVVPAAGGRLNVSLDTKTADGGPAVYYTLSFLG